MKRTAKYIKRVGNFMSNGVGLYEISPPCECGKDYAYVDDYTRGKVKCSQCGETLFEKFEEVCP